MPMVKGTKKIKSILDVGLKQQIGKGQSLYLTDAEFYDHRVQTALNMKLIVCEETAIRGSDGNKVRIKNIYRNSLSIGEEIRDLKPGQETVLDEDDLRSAHVQAAINKKMLKIVGSMAPGAAASAEATVKVGDVFKPTKTIATPVVSNPSQSDAPSDGLETNEEITGTPKVIEMGTSTTEVITDPNPPPAKSSVQDPRKKSVVWNPPNNPVMNPISNAVVMKGKNPMSQGTSENDPAFMERVAAGEINADVTPNPEYEQENIISDTNAPDNNTIGFVDQEQEKGRIANHPKLRSKNLNQNS